MKNKYRVGIIILLIILGCGLILIILLPAKKNAIEVPDSIKEEINQIGDSDIIWGDINCQNTIVAYIDYNCGYCKKFLEEILPKLNRNYIQEGKIKLVVRLVCGKTDIKAIKAYQTAICINKFGHYVKLHELLMHESKIIYTHHFEDLMNEYIVTNTDVAECILNHNNRYILNNIYQLQELKTNGTPTFVINNELIVGYKSFDYWKKKIEEKFNI